MSYDHYKYLIERSIESSSLDKLNAFSRDVVSRILTHVDSASVAALNVAERDLVQQLVSLVKQQPIDWSAVGQRLDAITSLEEDEAFLDTIGGEVLEFLCALDGWRDLIENQATSGAAVVSESLMNILDAKYVHNVSLDQWLSVPQLRDEFAQQVQYLKTA